MLTRVIPTPDELNNMSDRQYKALESRLRRSAYQQDLRLEKYRGRDPWYYLHGTYQLVDISHGGVMLAAWGSQSGYGLGLDEVAQALWGEDE
jgi:hypothetical protein